MAIRVALNHKTGYRYDQPVELSPQIVRLRPAPHARTPIVSYSLRVSPDPHFLNWQQDPQGNYLARLIFPERVRSFEIEVDLIAELTAINPFDFFVEATAERYPFAYEPWLSSELAPFLTVEDRGPQLDAWLRSVSRTEQKTMNFLVDLNRRLQGDVRYVVRLEPGVQTCEETLTLGSGSCRDSAWLLVQILRSLGLAARFVSGLSHPAGRRPEAPGGSGRARRRFHRPTRLDGGLSPRGRVGRSRPHLGAAGGRGSHPSGLHTRPLERGPDQRRCRSVYEHVRFFHVGRAGARRPAGDAAVYR